MGRLKPLTVDGLIYASSMVLDSARRKTPVPVLAAVRAIRAQLHVSRRRAPRLRDYLAAGAAGRAEIPAA